MMVCNLVTWLFIFSFKLILFNQILLYLILRINLYILFTHIIFLKLKISPKTICQKNKIKVSGPKHILVVWSNNVLSVQFVSHTIIISRHSSTMKESSNILQVCPTASIKFKQHQPLHWKMPRLNFRENI